MGLVQTLRCTLPLARRVRMHNRQMYMVRRAAKREFCAMMHSLPGCKAGILCDDAQPAGRHRVEFPGTGSCLVSDEDFEHLHPASWP